jgi:acyl-CoA thioester hydrolase
MLLIRHRVVARFRDCDPLGHVNNAVFLTYLEQARFALWRAQLNFVVKPPAAGEPRGQAFILARAEVDFRAQVRHGDEIDVALSLAAIGRTSVQYAYELTDVASGAVVATARTVQVWFDYDANRPVPIDDALKAKLGSGLYC